MECSATYCTDAYPASTGDSMEVMELARCIVQVVKDSPLGSTTTGSYHGGSTGRFRGDYYEASTEVTW